MVLNRRQLLNEVHEGSGSECVFHLSDNRPCLDKLLKTHSEQIKMIYMDPPYMTGEKFHMRVRMGENDWTRGKSSLVLKTYSDTADHTEYLDFMRDVLQKCHALLRQDGMLFLHVDYRLHPYMRLMLDEIFGEENFLNEIIWAYQSGGRSIRHFSRKHDVILFYAKSDSYDFNIQEVMVVPQAPRSNHMRKHVDPDGRVYRSIKVGGKVYTYYDDDPIAPSDVWSDLSHLQQRDPERTGYDTQKPLSLMDRIIRCSTRPGDIVLDPFCGSATTLEAAVKIGRSAVGIDSCGLVPNIIRRRLHTSQYTLVYPNTEISEEPICEAHIMHGVGFYHITIEKFIVDSVNTAELDNSDDLIDSWSVGYIRNDRYYVQDEYLRSRKKAKFCDTLNIPAYSGSLAMCINDVYGRSFLYELHDDSC